MIGSLNTLRQGKHSINLWMTHRYVRFFPFDFVLFLVSLILKRKNEQDTEWRFECKLKNERINLKFKKTKINKTAKALIERANELNACKNDDVLPCKSDTTQKSQSQALLFLIHRVELKVYIVSCILQPWNPHQLRLHLPLLSPLPLTRLQPALHNPWSFSRKHSKMPSAKRKIRTNDSTVHRKSFDHPSLSAMHFGCPDWCLVFRLNCFRSLAYCLSWHFCWCVIRCDGVLTWNGFSVCSGCIFAKLGEHNKSTMLLVGGCVLHACSLWLTVMHRSNSSWAISRGQGKTWHSYAYVFIFINVCCRSMCFLWVTQAKRLRLIKYVVLLLSRLLFWYLNFSVACGIYN